MSDRSFIRRRIHILFRAALVLSACAPNPETTAQKLVEAMNAQDVEEALALFAQDAIVQTSGPTPRAYTGPTEIRGWLDEMVGANLQIEVESIEIDGSLESDRDHKPRRRAQD
jgi:hypothetical protein